MVGRPIGDNNMAEDNKTRDKIILAVEELIASKGVNSFSLREIAKYLNISTGSLYYHFKTKDEIISAIIDIHFSDLESDYDAWLIKHKDDLTIERFLDVVFYKSTELYNHSKIHVYLINECMRNDEIKNKLLGLWNEWKAKIIEGVKRVYKNHDNYEEIASTILVIIEGLIIKTVLGNKTQEEIENIKKMLSRL